MKKIQNLEKILFIQKNNHNLQNYDDILILKKIILSISPNIKEKLISKNPSDFFNFLQKEKIFFSYFIYIGIENEKIILLIGRVYSNTILDYIKMYLKITKNTKTSMENEISFEANSVPVFYYSGENESIFQEIFIDIFRSNFQFSTIASFKNIIIIKEKKNKIRLNFLRSNFNSNKFEEYCYSLEAEILKEFQINDEEILQKIYPKNEIKKQKKLVFDDIKGNVGTVFREKQDLKSISQSRGIKLKKRINKK